MTRTTVLAAGALALLAVAACPPCRGGPLFHRHRRTPEPGRPRAIEHTHARAGFPRCLSPHAEPTNTPAYEGGYVGGGSSHGGCGRRPDEGTWGWDYVGTSLPRHVFLGWGHGRHPEKAAGSYTTDGPHVPDPIGATVNGLRNHGAAP